MLWSGYPTYISIGTLVTWDLMIIGDDVKLDYTQPGFASELLAAFMLFIMLALPFQRLYIFESLATSQRLKQNLLITLAILLAATASIVPLFFI